MQIGHNYSLKCQLIISEMKYKEYYVKARFYLIIGAMIYDLLILLAILLCVSVLPVILSRPNFNISHSNIYRTYLACITILFYYFCWRKSGQTLGMKAWGIKLISLDGKPVSLLQSAIRVLTAVPSFFIFGLGYLWMFFNKDKLTFHDLASQTTIVKTQRSRR